MASVVQIPNLPAVIALGGTELFESVQAGVSVKVTLSQISGYIQATPLAALTFSSPLLRTGNNVTLTTVPVTLGGTGRVTLTQNGLLYGNTAGAVGLTAEGATGQVLTGNTGSAPSWAALSGLGVTSFAGGTTGLTPSAATTGAITLAGTLVAPNGGTGQSSYAVGDILYASTTTALSKLADVATGNALISGGIGVAPSYGKIGLTTHVSGTLPVGNGGTGAATFTANGVLYGSGASAFGVTAEGATGQVLVGNTGLPPTWSTLSSIGVTTLSFGTTGLTPSSATSGAITVAGTLAPANGGTGITSLGTGVATALGINVGSAGAFVTFNGAGGTPSSITLSNGTGLPISTGVSGLGTGIAAALAINVGNAGAPVLFNGAGGTPSSITLSNGTGLPISTGVSGLGTGVATALGVNVGSAGAFITFNGAGGTPSSITLSNGTGLPISTGVTGLGTGVATWLGTPSSANLAAALTDETGTGACVFAGSPAFTGTPTAPTAANTVNSTQLATTAFVAQASPGLLYGLTLSTAGSSATFGIAAGRASDSTVTSTMILASAYTKTTSAWAVGTGNGALDTGAIANSTWYHVFLIQRTDTGVVDILISLSATSPTMPTNYTLFRRIGSMKTNGSAQWQSFVQKGDYFYIILTTDFTAGATSTATLRTLSVPTGIVVLPLLTLYGGGGGGGTNLFQLAPASDATLLAEVFRVGSQDLSYINVAASTAIGPPTNTSAQIYVAVPNYYSAAPPTLSTYGWIDMRGKDS